MYFVHALTYACAHEILGTRLCRANGREDTMSVLRVGSISYHVLHANRHPAFDPQ